LAAPAKASLAGLRQHGTSGRESIDHQPGCEVAFDLGGLINVYDHAAGDPYPTGPRRQRRL
jgi:hypothetical protein